MNEQKKAFMLRLAVENDGEWKSECEYAGEYVRSAWQDNMQQTFSYEKGQMIYISTPSKSPSCSYVVKCTKQEYLDFIDSLFEGAPDGAEYWHPNSKMFYVKHGLTYAVVDGENSVYHGAQLDESVHDLLIPRPRKQEKEKVAWSGAGLPPVGVECEYFDAIKKEWGNVFVVAHHMNGEEAIWSNLPDQGELFYGCKHDFRPLKTEAEKDRERLEDLLCVMDSIGTWDVKGDTLEESVCDTFGENTWQELCEALRLGIKVKRDETKLLEVGK